MEKQIIIKVLQSMLVDWNDSEKFKEVDKDIMNYNHTDLGYCHWLNCNPSPVEDQVINELRKDLKYKENIREIWYPTYINAGQYKAVFKNRIDHLNRTISRLESETTTI